MRLRWQEKHERANPGPEAGGVSPRLLLFAAVVAVLAAVYIVQNHSLSPQQPAPAPKTEIADSDDSYADPDQLAAAEQTPPSAQSPFEIVAQARAANGPPQPVRPLPRWFVNRPEQIGLGLVLMMGIVFATRKWSSQLGTVLNRATAVPEPALPSESPEYKAAVEKFIAAAEASPPPKPSPAQASQEALRRFSELAPDRLDSIKGLFAEVGRAPNPNVGQKILAKLAEQVRLLCVIADIPELQPVLQLGTALKALFEQMAERPTNITPSTLRTAAGAVVLLEEICKLDRRQHLVSEIPVRLLAVDDDLISRRAVSGALKKTFPEPDLAENGTKALEIANRNRYDVIFLDIEMPDLDGFEVCSRILQTDVNRNTPVVFVTSHSDFDSRTKSTASGGRDLIAKPFTSSEMTVKAFTWLYRSRLEQPKQPAPTPTTLSEQQVQPSAGKSAAAQPPQVVKPPSRSVNSAGPAVTSSSLNEFARHLFSLLSGMRESLAALPDGADQGQLQDIFGQIYIGLHSLKTDGERLQLKAFLKLTEAAGKLLRKIMEKPASMTPSVPHTLQAALDTLERLCLAAADAGPSDVSVRALVVDDDVIARRAMCNALQLSYTQPDLAENGESALTMARSKEFDVVFMDVLMPDLDGFETALRIRQSGLNVATPIVFVTSLADADSRAKATTCGGSGFICKPILPAEIALLALISAVAAAPHPTGPVPA